MQFEFLQFYSFTVFEKQNKGDSVVAISISPIIFFLRTC